MIVDTEPHLLGQSILRAYRACHWLAQHSAAKRFDHQKSSQRVAIPCELPCTVQARTVFERARPLRYSQAPFDGALGWPQATYLLPTFCQPQIATRTSKS